MEANPITTTNETDLNILISDLIERIDKYNLENEVDISDTDKLYEQFVENRIKKWE